MQKDVCGPVTVPTGKKQRTGAGAEHAEGPGDPRPPNRTRGAHNGSPSFPLTGESENWTHSVEEGKEQAVSLEIPESE